MGRPAGATPAFRADLARSVRLLRAFRTEQADPSGYYTVLAADTVSQLAQYTGLSGGLVLDAGGGPGFFVRAFRAAGARAFCADTDRGELAACGPPEPGCVVGSALRLPLASGLVECLLRQRPGARPGLAGDAGGNGPGNKSWGHHRRLVHQLAVPLGRA